MVSTTIPYDRLLQQELSRPPSLGGRDPDDLTLLQMISSETGVPRLPWTWIWEKEQEICVLQHEFDSGN